MKFYELTQEEKTLLQDFEKGGFKSVGSYSQLKNKYQAAARNTLAKTKNINLRLAERDLQKFKAKAAGYGIPYQTLASSVLHLYANE